MAKQRTFRPPLVPVERGADVDVVRWLARESFEIAAAGDGMEILDDTYTERKVPISEVPKEFADLLGRPVTDFDWYEFRAVGQVNEAVFDWLSAENLWQYDEYLKAEKAWQDEARAASV